MKERILVLNQTDKHTLGTVRCLPGLRAATDGEHIWLRGIAIAEKTDLAILQLPALITYALDQHNKLFPIGGLTPVATLKVLVWQSLMEFIPVELPVSVMPATLPEKQSIRLAASTQGKIGTALITPLTLWKAYAETAPEIRLKQVYFAVSDKAEVLLVGNPLVPLPGKEYWQYKSMLLPCGYDFDPPLLASLIESRLNPHNDFLLLFHPNGEWEQIPKSHFVQASRSAVRLTQVQDEVK